MKRNILVQAIVSIMAVMVLMGCGSKVEEDTVAKLSIDAETNSKSEETVHFVAAVNAVSNHSDELTTSVSIISEQQDVDTDSATEETTTTEDTKLSDNPFSGMTYDELGALDTSDFSDEEMDNYIKACQEAQAELDKNKPAVEKQTWTGKPFEEMTQEELKEVDTEALTKEDRERWLKRYEDTIVEKLAELDEQNSNSGFITVITGPIEGELWEPTPYTPVTIEPDGWLCY